MKNLLTKTTELALYMVKPYIEAALEDFEEKPGETFLVVDATCGNGHDTVTLAGMLFGDSDRDLDQELRQYPGRVVLIGTDIQEEAVINTRKALLESGFERRLSDGSIRILHGSHMELFRTLPETFRKHLRVVLFNLGYLPGGKKEITTLPETTLAAAKEAAALLDIGGVICITMYSGHSAGKEEKQELLSWVEDLDGRSYHSVYISMPNQKNAPPEILLITKKKGKREIE